jgi:hypothetical protein
MFKIQQPCAAGTSSGSIMKSSTVRKQNSFYRSTGIFLPELLLELKLNIYFTHLFV